MGTRKKWFYAVPSIGLLSSAILSLPTSSIAAINLEHCHSRVYVQKCIEQTDPGMNNVTHHMYETISKLLEEDDLEEQTNFDGLYWYSSWFNFIRLNYLILPSQNKEVWDQLNTIQKGNIDLKQILKILNGYHHSTNKITDVSTLRLSNMNVNKYIDAPAPDPESDQYLQINTTVINDSYTTTLVKKTQPVTRTIKSSKQLTVTHGLNTGIRTESKATFDVGIPLIGEVEGSVSFEYRVNHEYKNATATMDKFTYSVSTPVEEIPLQPRTAAVVTAKLSTPVYITKLLGTTRIKGHYTDQVNNYPTWLQLGIYNKFKVISQYNQAIWEKLKFLGFALDDQKKEVIFNGAIDLKVNKAPGSIFESRTQIYELDANGEINYSKPLGASETEAGDVEEVKSSHNTSQLVLRKR